jgi:hypothetical protein
MPWPVVLYSEFNQELQIVGYDLRLILHCDVGDDLSRTTMEVSCVVEDAAISAAAWRDAQTNGPGVLAETDRNLTGLAFRMAVSENGSVVTVNLVGEPQLNRRVNTMYENLRQLVLRSVVGFHAKLPAEWSVERDMIERNSRIFSIPAFQIASGVRAFPEVPDAARAATGSRAGAIGVPGQLRDPGEIAVQPLERGPAPGLRIAQPASLVSPATLGRSAVVHRLRVVKGAYVVESEGLGIVDAGIEMPLTYEGDLRGVAAYDSNMGYLTERRWVLDMSPTATNALNVGGDGWTYWQIGMLQVLGADEHPDLGASEQVARPQQRDSQLPAWPIMMQ